jgi:hypothetical protein
MADKKATSTSSTTSTTDNITATVGGSAEPPNPTLPMLWFFIITSVYFVIKMNVQDPVEKKVYMGVYILLLIIGQFFINLSLTTAMCGVAQWQTALNVTCIPWFLIFGVLNLFLFLFPDWLSPFSNTFGYLIAKLMGLNDFMDSILKPQFDTNARLDPATRVMAEALDHIYSDKGLLVNELRNPDTDVDSFFQKMRNLLDPRKVTTANEADLKSQLKYFVNVKHAVAEYIWYLLSGALVTSVSYNYIVNLTCSRSIQSMTKRRADYLANEKKLKDEKEANEKRTQKTFVNT